LNILNRQIPRLPEKGSNINAVNIKGIQKFFAGPGVFQIRQVVALPFQNLD